MSDAKLVLDTNIVSYLMKGGVLAEAYAPHVQASFSLSPLSPLANFISERKRQTGAR